MKFLDTVKIRRKLLCAMALILPALGSATPASAGVTTLTLDLAALPTGPFTTPQFLNGGVFVLTPALGASSIPQIVNSGGVYSLQSTNSVYAGGADTYLTRADGGAFSLLSVQIAALGGDNGFWGISIGNTGGGFAAGGYFGTPLSQSWTTVDLTASAFLQNTTFVDLDPISQVGPNFAIAAITLSYVTEIPEPATVSLLGAGLLALGALRRRRG